MSPRGSRLSWMLGSAAASALLLALFGRVEAACVAFGFVGLVPWLLGLDRAESLGEAALASAALSVAFVAALFPWLPAAGAGYSSGSPITLWIVMLLLAPLLEPQFMVFALVRHFMRRSPGPRPALRAAITATCAYIAAELLLPKLLFDTLGMGLYPARSLRQAADIAGVHGLTFVLLLFNECVTAALRRRHDRPARRAAAPLLGALGLVLVTFAYGRIREAQVEARLRPGPVIGLVQANITNYEKLRAEKGAFETVREILDTHVALSDEILKQARPSLILWPETVYPTTFGAPRSEEGEGFDAEITAFSKSRSTPLLFGAYDVEKDPDPEGYGAREFNAAFLLSGEPQASHYRKRMLFPLTEWVPSALDSAWLRDALPWTGHWQRGPGPAVLSIPTENGARLSMVPLICYDVLFPDFVAEAASKGGELIVTLSNDSWFPDERAPRLHLIAAAFRSIETRLPQVRATNSGISARIAPTGEITAQTNWNARAILVGPAPSAGRMFTPMLVLGPWLGPALLLLTLGLVGSAAWAKRGEAQAARGRESRPRTRRGAQSQKRATR